MKTFNFKNLLQELKEKSEKGTQSIEIQKAYEFYGGVEENGLYIPIRHSKQHKEKLLKDYGAMPAISFTEVFGKKITINEGLNFFSKYDPAKLLVYFGSLAKHIAHKGQSHCEKDEIQKDILQKAIKEGEKQGLELSEKFKSRALTDFGLISSDILNALIPFLLMGLFVGKGEDEVKDNEGYLGLATLVFNDHGIGSENIFEPGTKEFYLQLLRQNILNVSFISPMDTFYQKVFKFHSIYYRAWENMGQEQRLALDKAVISNLGVGFEDFF